MKSDNNINKENTNFHQQESEENSESILAWGDQKQRLMVQEPVNTTIKEKIVNKSVIFCH